MNRMFDDRLVHVAANRRLGYDSPLSGSSRETKAIPISKVFDVESIVEVKGGGDIFSA